MNFLTCCSNGIVQLRKKMANTDYISMSLSLLEKQENELSYLILEDHILSLKSGLQSLQTFYDISTNEAFKRRIRRTGYEVWKQLLSLSRKPVNGSLIQYLDFAYSDLRKKMKNVVINPVTGELDVIFPDEFDFKRIFDFITKSFGDLFTLKLPDDQYEMATIEENDSSIKKRLLFLQTLLTFVLSEDSTAVDVTEENKKILTPLVAYLDKVACLLFFCLVGKMDEEIELAVVNDNLSNLLDKNKFKEICIAVLENSKILYPNKNFLEIELHFFDNLIDHTSKSPISTYGVIQTLHDKLKILWTFLTDLPHEVKLEKATYLIPSIKAITGTALHIVFSCYDKHMKGEDVTEMYSALPEVIDQIDDIQEEVKEIKVHKYPKTDALGFLNLFLSRVEEFLENRPELIEILKSQIETLKDEFDSLRPFLQQFKEQNSEDEDVKSLWTCIIDLAYQAELVIDCYLVEFLSAGRFKFRISKILEKIKLIQSQVTRIDDTEKYITQANNIAVSSDNAPLYAGQTTDEVVGLQDELETIMEFVGGGQKQLDVISIVGMAGLGKTTFAEKIYKNPSLSDRFDKQAWCTISQVYRKREVLLIILGHIIIVDDEISNLNDHDLVVKLSQSLMGRRYLIVIDDLWDMEAWNDLKRSFPNGNHCSRIIITTRLHDVASEASSKVHFLRPLNDDETWKLFEMKLFQKKTYSEEFQQIGKEIAKNCKGLPLSIVVTAGLLGKVEKSIHEWNKIAKSLNSHIFSDSETHCKGLLELSYNHLPDHLKSCFLYFGAYLEDEEIYVKKLKWLWIGEGFVRNGNSLEELADEYLMDLVNRSLVTVSRKSSLGRIRTCRVHDLMHDFCLLKAQEDNFIHVKGMNRPDYRICKADRHRLKYYSRHDSFMIERDIGFYVRSLLHEYYSDPFFFKRSPNISFPVWKFKLLRVLDFGCVDIDENFPKIVVLIHLRYLAVGRIGYSIPSSISNLWNLQFFLIKQRRNLFFRGQELTSVPNSLWGMVNLRHVHIGTFELPTEEEFENFDLLCNVESLSRPRLREGDKFNLLKKLPKLQKLSCIFEGCWNYSSKCYQYPVLDFLDQLISLKLHFLWSRSSHSNVFKLPSNLQKLTLKNLEILGNEISKIGRSLPKLKVLKLIHVTLLKGWTVEDEDFPELKYLKLCGTNFNSSWNASDYSFPMLEELVLDRVSRLGEIPSRFEEIPTLQVIKVVECKKSVEESAKKIQTEQQEELCNMDLKVFIEPL